jgi:hypothetical protein
METRLYKARKDGLIYKASFNDGDEEYDYTDPTGTKRIPRWMVEDNAMFEREVPVGKVMYPKGINNTRFIKRADGGWIKQVIINRLPSGTRLVDKPVNTDFVQEEDDIEEEFIEPDEGF